MTTKAKTAKTEPTQDERLQDIGRRAFESIAEQVARLDAETEDGEPDEEARDKAREEIQEDPLSVQVRSGWYTPGEPDETPAEFELLLGTGGPAVRIVGELDAYGEPSRARLETQDWGTPWTEYRGGEDETLLAYARQFTYTAG